MSNVGINDGINVSNYSYSVETEKVNISFWDKILNFFRSEKISDTKIPDNPLVTFTTKDIEARTATTANKALFSAKLNLTGLSKNSKEKAAQDISQFITDTLDLCDKIKNAHTPDRKDIEQLKQFHESLILLQTTDQLQEADSIFNEVNSAIDQAEQAREIEVNIKVTEGYCQQISNQINSKSIKELPESIQKLCENYNILKNLNISNDDPIFKTISNTIEKLVATNSAGATRPEDFISDLNKIYTAARVTLEPNDPLLEQIGSSLKEPIKRLCKQVIQSSKPKLIKGLIANIATTLHPSFKKIAIESLEDTISEIGNEIIGQQDLHKSIKQLQSLQNAIKNIKDAIPQKITNKYKQIQNSLIPSIDNIFMNAATQICNKAQEQIDSLSKEDFESIQQLAKELDIPELIPEDDDDDFTPLELNLDIKTPMGLFNVIHSDEKLKPEHFEQLFILYKELSEKSDTSQDMEMILSVINSIVEIGKRCIENIDKAPPTQTIQDLNKIYQSAQTYLPKHSSILNQVTSSLAQLTEQFYQEALSSTNDNHIINLFHAVKELPKESPIRKTIQSHIPSLSDKLLNRATLRIFENQAMFESKITYLAELNAHKDDLQITDNQINDTLTQIFNKAEESIDNLEILCNSATTLPEFILKQAQAHFRDKMPQIIEDIALRNISEKTNHLIDKNYSRTEDGLKKLFFNDKTTQNRIEQFELTRLEQKESDIKEKKIQENNKNLEQTCHNSLVDYILGDNDIEQLRNCYNEATKIGDSYASEVLKKVNTTIEQGLEKISQTRRPKDTLLEYNRIHKTLQKEFTDTPVLEANLPIISNKMSSILNNIKPDTEGIKNFAELLKVDSPILNEISPTVNETATQLFEGLKPDTEGIKNFAELLKVDSSILNEISPTINKTATRLFEGLQPGTEGIKNFLNLYNSLPSEIWNNIPGTTLRDTINRLLSNISFEEATPQYLVNFYNEVDSGSLFKNFSEEVKKQINDIISNEISNLCNQIDNNSNSQAAINLIEWADQIEYMNSSFSQNFNDTFQKIQDAINQRIDQLRKQIRTTSNKDAIKKLSQLEQQIKEKI